MSARGGCRRRGLPVDEVLMSAPPPSAGCEQVELAVSPVAVAQANHPQVALRHRRDARRLTAQQLADLRKAIASAQQIKDDRGYQFWAGIHGLPLPIYCTHNSPLFLAWHRAYLYFFEKASQDA